MEEFKRLSEEGKYRKCQKKGHSTRLCPKYYAAIKPTNVGHIKSHNIASIQKLLSETSNQIDEGSDEGVLGEE